MGAAASVGGADPVQRAEGQPNVVGDRMLASLTRLGIPAVDGRSVIGVKDFWENNGHWQPSGHAKIGELLGIYLSNVRQPSTAAVQMPASEK